MVIHMNAEQLACLNVGEDLDQLMNLDPRGYGVCRILYEGARKMTGEPLTMKCAKELKERLKENDVVYIITGFVLLSNKRAEMDGIISAMLLARALVKAYGVKPLIICPEENLVAVRNLSNNIGLHLYETIEELLEYPISIGVHSFTKDVNEAEEQADELMKQAFPKAVIAIEAPGANGKGVYHNALGKDLTCLEAKTDALFVKCKEAGVWNMAIGDLGNELGMGALENHLKKHIPYMDQNGCTCGCGGGSMAAVAADNIITATVSDWGGYGLIAATAYLNQDMDIMHTGEMEEEVIKTASNSGMVDMYGWLEYAIDGIPMDFHVHLVELMRKCVENTLKQKEKCSLWFEKVLEQNYLDA